MEEIMEHKIECKLQTRSMAQLAEEVSAILNANIPDGNVSDLIQSSGYAPPHTINGIPIEELKAQVKDEDP